MVMILESLKSGLFFTMRGVPWERLFWSDKGMAIADLVTYHRISLVGHL